VGTPAVLGRLARVGCLSPTLFAVWRQETPEKVIMNSAEFHRERVIIGNAEYHITVGGQGDPVLLLHEFRRPHRAGSRWLHIW
jgi:hypothetical protein